MAEPSSPFGKLILAMDTSAREGSVALASPFPGRPGSLEVLARVTLGVEEEHASFLVPRIQELMDEVGADREEISVVVVGAGPGSFTGVRVGVATAKGFAHALRLPLWAFSSLAAAAVGEGSTWALVRGHPKGPRDASEIPGPEGEALRPRGVLFDARGERLYVGVFEVWKEGFRTLLPPRATDLTEVLEGLVPEGTLLMGDGAARHKDVLERGGFPVLSPPFGRPTADGLIRLLSLQPDTPPLTDPWKWEPEYLRASGAERMWKRRGRIGGK